MSLFVNNQLTLKVKTEVFSGEGTYNSPMEVQAQLKY